MSTWNDTNRFPHNNFIWKGIDGSSVYACVPPTHFITWNMPSQIQENWEAYQDKETGGQTLNMYGYGDGGSGCTEEMLEMIRRFDKVSVMPKIEVTGGDAFLHKNLKDNTNRVNAGSFSANRSSITFWITSLFIRRISPSSAMRYTGSRSII